jgi:hypothetical protein
MDSSQLLRRSAAAKEQLLRRSRNGEGASTSKGTQLEQSFDHLSACFKSSSMAKFKDDTLASLT